MKSYTEKNEEGYTISLAPLENVVYYSEDQKSLSIAFSWNSPRNPYFAFMFLLFKLGRVKLHANFISKWYDGAKIEDEKKKLIIKRVKRYFKKYHNVNIFVVT